MEKFLHETFLKAYIFMYAERRPCKIMGCQVKENIRYLFVKEIKKTRSWVKRLIEQINRRNLETFMMAPIYDILNICVANLIKSNYKKVYLLQVKIKSQIPICVKINSDMKPISEIHNSEKNEEITLDHYVVVVVDMKDNKFIIDLTSDQYGIENNTKVKKYDSYIEENTSKILNEVDAKSFLLEILQEDDLNSKLIESLMKALD